MNDNKAKGHLQTYSNKMKLVSSGLLLVLPLAQAVGIYSSSPKAIIPWPGKAPNSDDQSLIYNGTYYLADRNNNGVHVINLATNIETTLITGFVQGYVNGTIDNDISGPDGLVILPDRKELYVGDGDGSVKVIDLTTNTIVAKIVTGGSKRADEFAYDPTTDTIVVTNPAEETPMLTVISASKRIVLGNISFPNATELEQPAFNPADGKFYISVPSIPGTAAAGGEIAILDIATLSVSKVYYVPKCIPAGIVFGPTSHLFIGCSPGQIPKYGYAASYVMDVTTGDIIGNISGLSGIDQVTYSPYTNCYYGAAVANRAGGTVKGALISQLGVVSAATNTLLQTFATDNSTAHVVAVDNANGNVYVPIQAQGIVVYALASNATSTTVPASGSATSTKTGASATLTASAGKVMASFTVGLGLMILTVVLSL